MARYVRLCAQQTCTAFSEELRARPDLGLSDEFHLLLLPDARGSQIGVRDE
jgi:hypothetical protein